MEAYNLLKDEYFGSVDQQIAEGFRLKLKGSYTNANLFLNKDEQAAVLASVIQTLSITPVTTTSSSGVNELTEKLSSASLTSETTTTSN